MGGAKVHCEQSGVGHFLCKTEDEALDDGPALPVLPARRTGPGRPPVAAAAERAGDRPRRARPDERAPGLRHAQARQRPARRRRVLRDPGALGAGADRRLRAGSTARWSASSRTTRCTRAGCCSSTRPTRRRRFVQLCDAFNVPLLFLSDVPGFMVGSAVEKQGIIRHGAKMVTAISEATVPKICVVVRKAYGAGLYAMAGPGFEPDATIALPTAKIAVMGAEAAVNAVYANKIAALAGRRARGVRRRQARRVRAATSTSSGWRQRAGDRHDRRARQRCATSSSGGTPPRRARTVTSPGADTASPRFERPAHDRLRRSTRSTRALRQTVRRVRGRRGRAGDRRLLRAARVPVRPGPPDGQDGAVRPAVPQRVRRRGRRLLRAVPRAGGVGPGRLERGDHAGGRGLARRDADLPVRHRASRRSAGCRRCAGARRWPRSGSPSPASGPTPAAPRPGAVLRDDQWVINGSKAFITNSGTDITSLVTVTAVTGQNRDGTKELSTIIVPSGTPGFTVRPGTRRSAGARRTPTS